MNASSFATSHWTGIALSGIPPLPLSGAGASRVQSTAPSGVGSPDATPSVNGYPVKRGGAVRARANGSCDATTAPAAVPATVRKRRRDRPSFDI